MPWQTAVTSTKEAVSVVRELALIIAVVAIVMHPGFVAQWAKSFNEAAKAAGAKSTGFSLGPMTFSFDNDTTQAISAIQNASNVNDKVREMAAQLKANATPVNSERARKIEESAQLIASQLETSLDAVRSVQLQQDKVMQEAQGATTGSGRYGIVVSADKQEDLAAYEIRQIKTRHIGQPAIYVRQGFLRTVARFSDYNSARQQLPSVQSYRKSAYLINLDKWCPNPTDSGKVVGGAPVLKLPVRFHCENLGRRLIG